MNKPKITLIRGLPGSGKSTLARQLVHNATVPTKHVEADMFMINRETGNYEFDPARLPGAHARCRVLTRHTLESGRNVVVSNTFSQMWELQPYFSIANALNLGTPTIIECQNSFGSIHNVPEEAMQRMRERWEPCDLGRLILGVSLSCPRRRNSSSTGTK